MQGKVSGGMWLAFLLICKYSETDGHLDCIVKIIKVPFLHYSFTVMAPFGHKALLRILSSSICSILCVQRGNNLYVHKLVEVTKLLFCAFFKVGTSSRDNSSVWTGPGSPSRKNTMWWTKRTSSWRWLSGAEDTWGRHLSSVSLFVFCLPSCPV